jgi:hypothetical protein
MHFEAGLGAKALLALVAHERFGRGRGPDVESLFCLLERYFWNGIRRARGLALQVPHDVVLQSGVPASRASMFHYPILVTYFSSVVLYAILLYSYTKYMGTEKKVTKMSSSEKAAAKKQKHKENVSKSNPMVAAANKAASDAKRARRAESGSTKAFK